MGESQLPETKVRIPNWLWLGSACWLLVVFLVAWLVFWPNLAAQTPPIGLKPNEFGDLLAGAFSPLAFAWFVYAVFMQREELELQRKELVETRVVLKEQKSAQDKSAKSNEELAKLTKTQNFLSTDQRLSIYIDQIFLDFQSRARTSSGSHKSIEEFGNNTKNINSNDEKMAIWNNYFGSYEKDQIAWVKTFWIERIFFLELIFNFKNTLAYSRLKYTGCITIIEKLEIDILPEKPDNSST